MIVKALLQLQDKPIKTDAEQQLLSRTGLTAHLEHAIVDRGRDIIVLLEIFERRRTIMPINLMRG